MKRLKQCFHGFEGLKLRRILDPADLDTTTFLHVVRCVDKVELGAQTFLVPSKIQINTQNAFVETIRGTYLTMA